MARKLAAMGAALFALAALPSSSGAVAVVNHAVSADLETHGNFIRVNASGTASPLGSFSIAVPGSPLTVVGKVLCMRVSGNTAYVVYLDNGVFPRRDGTVGGYIRMLDNAGGDMQNNGRFLPRGLSREVANGCPVPTAGPAFHPLHAIDSGTIT